MAKRKSKTVEQTPLPTMEDEFNYPPEVVERVEAYTKALKAKGRANSKVNTEKDKCIEAMTEQDCPRVRYQDENGNWKYLKIDEKVGLKIEKPKKEEQE